MAAYMVSEGYALADILDYENGMPFEELAIFQRAAQRISLARTSQAVNGMVVAIGSMFDKKVLKEFTAGMTKALAALGPTPRPAEDRAERTARTIRELGKLRKWMGGTSGPPPWEAAS